MLSPLRARARGLETGSEPPPESGNHRGACLRGRAGSWKLIRRLGLRPADGALSRPDMAEGALSGAAIAQGAEIALSGHDRADAAGDRLALTPGIGRRPAPPPGPEAPASGLSGPLSRFSGRPATPGGAPLKAPSATSGRDSAPSAGRRPRRRISFHDPARPRR